MSDERRDLVAAEALGALSPAESAELGTALERDPALAGELEEYRATVAVLEAHVARAAPSHDLFPGILAEVEPVAARAPERPPRRAWGWRRALPAFAVGAVATAAVFAAALALDSTNGLGAPDDVAPHGYNRRPPGL